MPRHLALIAGLAAVGIAPAPAMAATTARVSLSNAGLELDADSVGASLSADGRFVGFHTVVGSNGDYEAFVRDRSARKTVRVSLSTTGEKGNAGSAGAQLSYGGRYVAFTSTATNLDSHRTGGIFLRDRDTDADRIYDEAGAVSTRLVSLSTAGIPANGQSTRFAISSDGQHVAFVSGATNLVAGDTNGKFDVFVRDHKRSRTIRVSVATSGAQASGESFATSISGSGRYVAFDSDAANLVDGDTNGHKDVFVHDRDTDADGVFDESAAVRTIRVSVSSSGAQGSGSSSVGAISANGRHVTFHSEGPNLTSGDTNNTGDVFVRDLRTGKTTRVSVSTGGAQGHAGVDPQLSGNGRYVAFWSGASTLVAGDTNGLGDIFLRDRDTDADGVFDEAGAVRTIRASVSSAGAQGDGESYHPLISENGNLVGFTSYSTNLGVNPDTNHDSDVFARTNP